MCLSWIADIRGIPANEGGGVNRYHSNLETSRRYFPFICTSHTYDDKIANIRRAQKAGLDVCSGGIIGMGETWEDRIDMAISLAELGVYSIPLNVLRPISGTPFEHLPPISNEDILRTWLSFGTSILPLGSEWQQAGASSQTVEPDFFSLERMLP